MAGHYTSVLHLFSGLDVLGLGKQSVLPALLNRPLDTQTQPQTHVSHNILCVILSAAPEHLKNKVSESVPV